MRRALYLGVLVGLPVVLPLRQGLQQRLRRRSGTRSPSPTPLAALKLSVEVAAIAVPVNTVVGIGAALLIARHRFVGRRVFDTDLRHPGRGVADHHRRGARPRLLEDRLVRRPAARVGDHGPLLAARHRARDDGVSLPYVLRSVVPVLDRGRHRSRSRRRARSAPGGCGSSARHAALDPLGACSTASRSPSRARSASSAPSSSSRATSPGRHPDAADLHLRQLGPALRRARLVRGRRGARVHLGGRPVSAGSSFERERGDSMSISLNHVTKRLRVDPRGRRRDRRDRPRLARPPSSDPRARASRRCCKLISGPRASRRGYASRSTART